MKWARINFPNELASPKEPYINIWWSDGTWYKQWAAGSSYLEHCAPGYTSAVSYAGIDPVLGGWMKVAIYGKANTGSNRDGKFKIWMKAGDFIPNTETPSYSCDTWIWDNRGTMTFFDLEFMSNIGDPSADCINYVDDIKIYDGMPDYDVIAPANPGGLNVS